MFIGQLVTTPYGAGVIKSFRTGVPEDQSSVLQVIVVEPIDWIMAGGQKPTFYLNPKDVTPMYDIGKEIDCPFGRGTVGEIRDLDGMYVVHLKNWFLATNKSPVLYLNQESVRKPIEANDTALSKPPPPPSISETCLKNCIAAKDLAKAFFQKNDYVNAKDHYIIALSSLRYLDDSNPLTNVEKAKYFQQTIPCHNNTAVCCLRLKQYKECFVYAGNSCNLISALEQRFATSEVFKELQNLGVDLDQMMKWKRNSLFYMGKAMLLSGEFKEAREALENAIKITPPADTSLIELKDMLAKVKGRYAGELKKDQSTWGRAFKMNAVEPEESGKPEDASSNMNQASSAEDEIIKKQIKKKAKSANKNKKPNDRLEKANNQVSNYSGYLWGGAVLFGVTLTTGLALYLMRSRKFR